MRRAIPPFPQYAYMVWCAVKTQEHLYLTLATPRSSQWSLPFGPPNQNPVNISPFPMSATRPTYLILLDLITLTILGEEYRP
jgi:hypothetical protein